MMIFKSNLWSLLAVAGTTSEAFVPASFVNRVAQTSRHTCSQWRAATIDEVSTNTINGASKDLTTWECNEDAECVEVPACDQEQCRTSLDVRIHGEWFDLTGPCLKFFVLYRVLVVPV